MVFMRVNTHGPCSQYLGAELPPHDRSNLTRAAGVITVNLTLPTLTFAAHLTQSVRTFPICSFVCHNGRRQILPLLPRARSRRAQTPAFAEVAGAQARSRGCESVYWDDE